MAPTPTVPGARALGFLLLLLGSVALPARAQDRGPSISGAGAFVLAGWSGARVGAVNDLLVPAGESRFPSAFATIGGGGFLEGGRILLGGEALAHLERSADASLPAGRVRAALSGSSAFFVLGIVVHDAGGFRVFPFAGVGGGRLTLRFAPGEGPVFADVSLDPRRETEMSLFAFLLQAGIGAEWRLGGRTGPTAGLRAGYVFSTGRPRWERGSTEVAGGPGASLAGAYVRLAVGFGSRRAG